VGQTSRRLSTLSCAIIFKGTREVSFSTEPESASVYVSGMYTGKGSFQQNLASNGSYAVECRKPGYETRAQTVNHSIGAGWIILDVLEGFVPDPRRGDSEGSNQLERTTVRCSLEHPEIPVSAGFRGAARRRSRGEARRTSYPRVLARCSVALLSTP
jgi:hypothetical protein